MAKELKNLTKRADNYSQWYNDLVVKADLAELSPVRGCMIIKPYGYAIWEKMQQQLDKMFKQTGVQNAYFPLLIPKSFFSREAEHVAGFASRLEQWYAADNCRSKNEFVEKAVNFYVDYLEMQDNQSLLPTALLAALDGRLGRLEDHIARREFTREVELDLLIGIIADAVEVDRDDLKRRRAESVRNVKATNGLISLEKRARAAEEPNWDGDQWQD